ncbi:hypothetical protein AX016_2249 [Cellulophaga sp. RHA19]|nr:hypothetical protein AX016_2249 [Cellulophaga sp. RHA19]
MTKYVPIYNSLLDTGNILSNSITMTTRYYKKKALDKVITKH